MSQIIAIPDSLNNRGHDLVWFSYTKTGVKEEVVVNGAPCYWQCMSILSECDFVLRPSDDKSLLPYPIFEKYINLCKENGIVNSDAYPREKEGNNELVIPKGHNKHKVYSSLCCYRWSENQPGMAFATVKAMEQFPEIDFFQAFHYGCARRVYWLIHSFHNIVMNKSTYSTGMGDHAMLYLPHSLFVKYFFYKNPDTDKSLAESKKDVVGQTCDAITKEISNHKFPSCTVAGSEKYKLKHLDQILSPKLTKLYKEKITLELVEKTLLEI